MLIVRLIGSPVQAPEKTPERKTIAASSTGSEAREPEIDKETGKREEGSAATTSSEAQRPRKLDRSRPRAPRSSRTPRSNSAARVEQGGSSRSVPVDSSRPVPEDAVTEDLVRSDLAPESLQIPVTDRPMLPQTFGPEHDARAAQGASSSTMSRTPLPQHASFGNRNRQLETHWKRIIPLLREDGRRYTCSTCNAKLDTVEEFFAHNKWHTGRAGVVKLTDTDG
jgi:hypothetical protein